jgi:hypothetical protein
MRIISEASSTSADSMLLPLIPHTSEYIETQFSSTLSCQSLKSLSLATTAGFYVVIQHQHSADKPARPAVLRTTICDMPGESYKLRLPIPVTIRRMGDGEYLASFVEANIGMSGETQQEALQNLIIDILDAFELFLNEENNLGPEPSRELTVLKRYLSRKR